MVYGFVKQSGGHVKIYSELGHGTTIRIYLPRAVGRRGSLGGSRTPRRRWRSCEGRGETVLVVEDEPRVRRMTVARLQELGYRVLEARQRPRRRWRVSTQHPESTCCSPTW